MPQERWATSQAKIDLREAMLAGNVPETMKPKEVYEMSHEHKKFKYENFRTNLNTMRKSHKAGNLATEKKMVAKWGKSEAKRILREDVISGVVPNGMPAKDIYEMHEEYKDYKFDNFKTNVANLRGLIETNISRMISDCVAYGQDRALLRQLHADNPPRFPPYPAWHKSEAKKLLKEDIDNGVHDDMDPIDMYQERAECREFPLSVFRKHIYQEVDERASRAHRFAKKKHRTARPKETADQSALLT